MIIKNWKTELRICILLRNSYLTWTFQVSESLQSNRRPSKNCSVRVATDVKKTCGRKNSRVFENCVCKLGAGGDTNRTIFSMADRAIEEKSYMSKEQIAFPDFFPHLRIGKSAKNMMQAGDANRTIFLWSP